MFKRKTIIRTENNIDLQKAALTELFEYSGIYRHIFKEGKTFLSYDGNQNHLTSISLAVVIEYAKQHNYKYIYDANEKTVTVWTKSFSKIRI